VAGGDFFDTFSRWLGAKSGSKEVVAKIDGHKVTVGELDGPRGIKFRRVMANRFMALAADKTTRTLEASISEQLPRLSEEGQQTAIQAMQIAGMIRRQPLTPDMAQGLSFFANQMTAKIESPTAKSEDKEVARAAQRLFLLMGQAAGDHFFTNAPNRTQRDLIEFMLWEKKADQLGIRFTRNDVNKLIQAEFGGYFRDDGSVRKAMQSTPGFTVDAVLDAIATEFKVRAAQTAVLGYVGRYRGAPGYPTPYELFEYYREQTSPSTYDVISVPAAAFVDKVVGEPTENEIADLFKKYASDEPNPKNETPGFKEPRKISVAYLGITGEEPYYKKLAAEQMKVGEVMAKASGALATPLPGGVGTWVAGAVAPLGLKEPAVDAAYAAYVREFNEQHKEQNYKRSTMFPRSRFSSLESDDPLLPTSTVRPGVAAAALGAFALGNVGPAATLSMTAPLAYEIRDRVTTGMPLVLGAIPNPALMQTALAGAARYKANEPKPLSIETMRPELMKQTIDKRAQTLAFGERPDFRFGEQQGKPLEKGDVKRFIEELGKLTENGKPKDKAAVEKFINDFIAARGLTHSGGSKTPRDEWTLEDDRDLQPLVLAQKEGLRDARSPHGGQYMPFGRSFFWKSEPDLMGMGGPRPKSATTGLYQAQPYPSGDPDSRADGRPHYVVWRTEDVPAKPTNAITARPAVIAAWKRQKARALAEAYANEMADKIRKYPNTDPILAGSELRELHFQLQRNTIDPKASDRARLFQVANVAPLTMDILGRVQPFNLPESADVPYPTPAMVTALLENRDKPVKTVLVLPDAPKDTFYVATLMNRQLKHPDDFKRDVYSSRGGGFGGPTLGQAVNERFRVDAMMKSRQSVVDLLKKEFKYEETEDQKKKLDDNTKSGGRDTD
jgi:hypothetical protein